MLTTQEILDARLDDWRKLGQAAGAGCQGVGATWGHAAVSSAFKVLGVVEQEVAALGKPEPQQPVGVLVGAALPRRVRVAEEQPGAQGDDVRDPTGRVPILWFQDTDAHEERIAAAVAAGGRVETLSSQDPWQPTCAHGGRSRMTTAHAVSSGLDSVGRTGSRGLERLPVHTGETGHVEARPRRRFGAPTTMAAAQRTPQPTGERIMD